MSIAGISGIGPIQQLLFPIHHGVLHYSGMAVLPPFLIYRTSRVDEASFAASRRELGLRLNTLQTTSPIPFRLQNHGDYDIPSLTLKDHLAPNKVGLEIHVKAQE